MSRSRKPHKGTVTTALFILLVIGIPGSIYFGLHQRTNQRVDQNATLINRVAHNEQQLAAAQRQIIVDRTEARIAACNQYNAGVDASRVPPDALEAQIVLIVLYIEMHATPADLATVQPGIAQFFKIYSTAADHASAHRDCSPSGITAQYAPKKKGTTP